MDKCIIFYSWESDLPNSTNRGFIQRALEDAAKSIRNDDSIKIDPVIDRDTSGVPGSPDIANTIFSKIDASDIFVCDVSIINQGEKARQTSNPNVLIELGYAIKGLKSERIIMIMNTAFGGPELLPFDLSKKRVSTYRISEDNEDKSTERKKLTQLLDDAIRAIMSHANKSKIKGKRSGEKSKLKEECEEVLHNGNKQDWRGLVDELWRDIPKQLFEWKIKTEKIWEKGPKEKESARFEAVEMCLPSFVPIFVALENGREDLWQESIGLLRQLLMFSMGSGFTEVIEIGPQMLYFAGNIGMAIAARTKQMDFINKWMRLPMPGKIYRDKGEKTWAEVKEAHHLWGKYLPGNRNPFGNILKICESDYISGFFPDKERLTKNLFLGNLGQSLFELGQCINDEEFLKIIKEKKNKQELRPDVWPLWVLMKTEEFQTSTWELFGSSDGVIKYVFPKESIPSQDFWNYWKEWKRICVALLMQSEWPNIHSGNNFLILHDDVLLLPGETY